MDRIDEIDARILELLQEKGRIKRSRIAEEVGLSLPSVSDRMKKLEDRGVITGYHAVVDPRRLHFDITVYVRVMVDRSSHYASFVKNAMELQEVQEGPFRHRRGIAYSESSDEEHGLTRKASVKDSKLAGRPRYVHLNCPYQLQRHSCCSCGAD